MTLTPAALKAEEITALNFELAEIGDCAASWWSYTASLNTFELVVGQPTGAKNLVIAMMSCQAISGPTNWHNQRLKVIFAPSEEVWHFSLIDQLAGFSAQANMLSWRKNFDIVSNHGFVFKTQTDR
jgi:hypothetical protein